MAAIRDLSSYNNDRRELMKIKTANDETILFTKEEAKLALVKYIDEELELMTTAISHDGKAELEGRLNFKLKQMEISLIKHIDEKLDTITEKIVELTINRKVEEEVEKRLELRLQKLKKLL